MPVQRLPRERWEPELRSYGCEPLKGKTPLNTAEWWRWPWGGCPFTVPVDPDDYVETWAFQRLLADMARLAPPNWEFPDPTKS